MEVIALSLLIILVAQERKRECWAANQDLQTFIVTIGKAARGSFWFRQSTATIAHHTCWVPPYHPYINVCNRERSKLNSLVSFSVYAEAWY